MLDQTPRYAPAKVTILGHGIVPVQGWTVHPPGTHPKSAIISTLTALECRTAAGSRWYGVTCGYINSELRMVIEGTNPRDVVRMKWAIVPEEMRDR